MTVREQAFWAVLALALLVATLAAALADAPAVTIICLASGGLADLSLAVVPTRVER